MVDQGEVPWFDSQLKWSPSYVVKGLQKKLKNSKLGLWSLSEWPIDADMSTTLSATYWAAGVKQLNAAGHATLPQDATQLGCADEVLQ